MSNYPSFQVYFRDRLTGAVTNAANVTVEVRDVTDDPACALLDETETDANGTVPGAAVDVAAGRTLRFTFKDENNGRCGSCLKVTV
ncbi:MAG TPA: hypothetical protein VGB98_12820 [Pyrinomonadaceae bacterium]|jgi:hypothetical protein